MLKTFQKDFSAATWKAGKQYFKNTENEGAGRESWSICPRKVEDNKRW